MNEWLLFKFGTIRAAAKAMKMGEANLQQYLAGNRRPGFTVFMRLSKLGCDINWLLNGKSMIDNGKFRKRLRELDKAVIVLKRLGR